MRAVWIWLLLALALIVIGPLAFAEFFTRALAKLHLSPEAAVFFAVGIFVGGLFNIPVKRVTAPEPVPRHLLDVFGMGDLAPAWRVLRPETIVAVNVGGCLVPAGLAAYELAHLGLTDPALAGRVLFVGAGVNVALCYAFARPVRGLGIIMPGFIPPVAAAVLGLILAPGEAPPAAFVIGVLGPLIGADLLNLRAIERLGAGMVSIGGAGTFDGIVLSAIIAAYLA